MRVSRQWLGIAMLLLSMCVPALSCARTEPAGGDGKSGGSGKPIQIVATTGMVADMVREIAGDRAVVRQLMGAGVDPHLYKPTRADIALLSGADAVFYSGLLLEGKMTDTFDRLKAGRKPVVAITTAIDESRLRNKDAVPEPTPEGGKKAAPSGEGQTHHDPHVWMDPSLWALAVGPVRDALIAMDPASKAGFDARASAYAAKLKALDTYAETVLKSVPEKSRVLVTAHDAFGYFGRRYGYQVEGIQGISTESEAGVRDIQRLVDLLVDRSIKSVFIETSVSERNINALIAGAKAKGHEVKIGGLLFSDAPGAEGTYEGTYIGMLDHNVTSIVRALGGQAPARGMNGSLAEGK